jgi:Holliday junction DNA helicase RuvA
MISYVKGILDHKEPGHVIIDVSGLGYEVFIPLSTYEKLPALGNQVKLHTHHHIREDAMQLYGFISQEEKDTFVLLMTISGVGAKVALSVLSAVSVDEFRRSVAQGDMKSLTKIPGIGKKSAERMMLELKDKVGMIHVDTDTARIFEPVSINEAVSALLNLGASPQMAEFAVYKAEKILGKDARIEEIIAQALKSMAG